MNTKHAILNRVIDSIDGLVEINGVDCNIPVNAVLYEFQIGLIAQTVRLERLFRYEECI